VNRPRWRPRTHDDSSGDERLVPVDISGAWPVKTVHDAVSEALGEQVDAGTDLATLRKFSDAVHIPYRAQMGCRCGGAGAVRAPG